MIEKLFRGSRLLVLIAVAATAISAVLLYFSSLSILAHIVIDVAQDIPRTTEIGKNLAVKLLKVLDLLLIAITFHVTSVSLYRLFITPLRVEESTFLNVLHIKSFHDLKITVMQVSIVILVILFLEQAVEVGATLESLYFGAAVAMVILASVFACKNMD
ncbi:MAG: YqhA family protein [Gammaproteobacteria bacterium]|nr:YqhA family protein [Gammaproteobacteria bacterium]